MAAAAATVAVTSAALAAATSSQLVFANQAAVGCVSLPGVPMNG
jgi:hypothetical protein